MRVCVVSPFPPSIGGIGDYGAHLAQQLALDPRVESLALLADVAGGAPSSARIGRVEVHRVWRRDGAGVGLSLARAIATLRPDVVWFNLGLTMFGTRPLAAASGLAAVVFAGGLVPRTVVTLHELPAMTNLKALGLRSGLARLGAAMVPRMVLHADTVVVTLDRYRRYLMDRYGAGNVVRIPLGAHGEPDSLQEPVPETVLVLGAFGPHKEPGLVAEAVARVRRVRPGLRLLIAGADHPRYPGFMADHGLEDSFIGYVAAEGLGALFAQATVVVVPSRASTGASGVIYRAASNGRPVLASDLPDFRGLAHDEDLRLSWFRAGDAASLASALQALLGDAERRRAMVGHNLRALHRLAPARIADAYLTAFAAPLARHPQRGAPAVPDLAPLPLPGEA